MADFPRAQSTWNGRSLYQVTDVTYTHTNGAKLKNTLRRDASGTSRGVRAIAGSMNVILPDDPEEADDFDWPSAVRFKIPQSIVLKMPTGERLMLDLVLTEEGAEITIEDAVKKPIKFTGYYVDLAAGAPMLQIDGGA